MFSSKSQYDSAALQMATNFDLIFIFYFLDSSDKISMWTLETHLNIRFKSYQVKLYLDTIWIRDTFLDGCSFL